MNRARGLVVTIVASALLVTASCAEKKPASATSDPAPVASIPEERIGLAAGRLEDLPPLVPSPGMPSDPGEASVQPPAYAGSPPIVPHAVDEFLPIRLDDNACLSCHQIADKVEGEPTPIPASHYQDLRNAPNVRGQQVVGARWVYVSCHVAPSATAPLVRNSF